MYVRTGVGLTRVVRVVGDKMTAENPNCPKDFHKLYGIEYNHAREKALFAFDFAYQIDYLLGSKIADEETRFVKMVQAHFLAENSLPAKLADQLRYLFEREFDKDAGVEFSGLS